jgi:hypothetical protein
MEETKIISTEDYQLVESNDVEFYGIKLLTGKWKDVVYIYGQVKIKESPELDIATLGFTYNIQEAGGFEEEDLINDIHFRNYIGGVLQNVIEESLDNGAVIGHNESNTNTHIKSSS